MSKPTTVRFQDAEAARLAEIARRRGTTVSDLVQRAVRIHYLERDRTAAVEHLLEYVAAHPADVEDTADEVDARIQDAWADAAR